MRPPRTQEQWKGRTAQIKVVDSAQYEQKMHEAIAQRAFANFESRGSSPGNASVDWRRAESEVVRPLQCGFIVGDKAVSVETDASAFEEGPIEICVEPRRVTMCDKRGSRATNSPTSPVFYVLELPVTIDPSKTATRFNGGVLMIELPLSEESRRCRDARDERGGFLSPRPASGAMLH